MRGVSNSPLISICVIATYRCNPKAWEPVPAGHVVGGLLTKSIPKSTSVVGRHIYTNESRVSQLAFIFGKDAAPCLPYDAVPYRSAQVHYCRAKTPIPALRTVAAPSLPHHAPHPLQRIATRSL